MSIILSQSLKILILISCFRVCIVKKILFSKMTRPARERKIAILGYRSVGKSCLTIQFIESKFVEYYEPTIEHTFKKSIVINGQRYDLSLVDTAGQDEYTIFPPEYSVEMNGYVLVYSIDSPQSFEICKNWWIYLEPVTFQQFWLETNVILSKNLILDEKFLKKKENSWQKK